MDRNGSYSTYPFVLGLLQAYTISTVGEEAFLQILPVYIDHILYATMFNPYLRDLTLEPRQDVLQKSTMSTEKVKMPA